MSEEAQRILIALASLATMFIAFLVAVFVFRDSDEAAETIVAVLGPIGTLAGLIVGERVGSAGRGKAETRADDAQKRAEAAEQRFAVASAAEPTLITKARRLRPDLFPEQ
jgi:hypothetical protein